MRIGASYGSSPVIRSYISKRLPYFASTASRPSRVDGVGEVEVDAQPAGADAAALVADVLGGAGGDVARHQVAERRVDALQVVVALVLGDLARRARSSPCAFGTQTRPSLRSDSLISVSFDWWSPETGMQVGWICV